MSFVPSRPTAPDSEAPGLDAPSPDDPAARVRALACRILGVCHAPSPDDPSFALDAQFFTLGDAFRELLMTGTHLHGMDERRGLTFALRAQKQALAAALTFGKIKKYDARTIED